MRSMWGLPASGIGHVQIRRRRQAFRVYLEDAAAALVRGRSLLPALRSVYDRAIRWRSHNIGFVDVCNRPYAPLVTAA